MLLAGKDGELRISDYGNAGTTNRIAVLFCEMDFTGPTSRPRTGETLIMDRGNMDSNAHYMEGNDEPRYAALPISFSCKMADTIDSGELLQWVSGVTKISGTTQLWSYKGQSAGIDGNTLPDFKEGAYASGGTSGKFAYMLEVLWDGTTDLGLQYNEIYFPPGESSINESADGLTLNVNGQVYGDVTKILAFNANTTAI